MRGAEIVFAAVSLALLSNVRCDVIFRVPEVLVRHAAASKSVGTGPANATRINDTESLSRSRDDGIQVKYEEYFVEHEVSTADARAAAETLNLEEVNYEEYFVEHEVSTADARTAAETLNLDEVPDTLVGCGACSRRELEYCETRLLADHCCCERRYVPEPFPWLPHTCYMGPARCRPLAHDCARYARLRDCCCYKQLANRWKGILSKSTRFGASGASLLLVSMMMFVVFL
ncbi:hypothetical protein O0L34_g11034 [Tuta absoluta]|nr:hypothetical protein O0L34_g11034 [Tuta absoluta]